MWQWFRKLLGGTWYLVDNEGCHCSYWTRKKPTSSWYYIRKTEKY